MSFYRFEMPTLAEAVAFLAWRKLNTAYQSDLHLDTIQCQRVVTMANESVADRNVIAGQPLIEDQQMPKEREAPQMGSFFKFTELGQSVAGKIAKYAVHDKNGPFVTIAPCIIWPSRSGQPQQFATCAIGLSMDLRMKIHADDVGKFMSMSFREKEPTAKGSPLKRFRVEELTQAEMVELARGNIDKTNKALPYTTTTPSTPDDEGNSDELDF